MVDVVVDVQTTQNDVEGGGVMQVEDLEHFRRRMILDFVHLIFLHQALMVRYPVMGFLHEGCGLSVLLDYVKKMQEDYKFGLEWLDRLEKLIKSRLAEEKKQP